MTDTTDFIGEIHTWLARYDRLTATHTERLSEFENDEEREGYADARFTNALESEDFLDRLAAHLRELVGPPVPGTPFTLTWAGPERHDGGKPHSFVVCGNDLDDARRTLVTLPFWRQWHEKQRGWNDPDGQAPDALFIADASHPGIPALAAYTDLRREQAAAAPLALTS
ncbi:hypothetical protein ACWC1D_25665 [Streptomyces sp. NPDC001478]